MSLHFSRSLLSCLDLFRSHTFATIGFEPLHFTSQIFLAILEGNCTEQDKVKLETDDAVEDAALEAKEADCKEKKGAWHLFALPSAGFS